MPKIYRVRNPVERTQWFSASHPQARKILLEHGEYATLETLEYEYKWQLVVMMNEAYLEGRDDGAKEMAECS
jgi:hypothetical protein